MTFNAAYFPDTGPSYRGTVTINDDGTGKFTSTEVLALGGAKYNPDSGSFTADLTAEAVKELQEIGQSREDRLVMLNMSRKK